MKLRIKWYFLPFRRLAIGGMVLYPFVLFKRKREEVSDRLFRHEMQHVYQVQREGWWKFYLTYLYYQVRYGYKNNPYEVEARLYENAPLSPYERSLKEQA